MSYSYSDEDSSKTKIIAIFVITFLVIYGFGQIYLLYGSNASATTLTSTTTTSTDTTTTTITATGNPNPHQVAIVFDVGGLGDRSYNDACYAGVQQAAHDFGISFTYVESSDISEYEGYLRAYAAHQPYDDSYGIIISVGFDQRDALQTVAEENPNQNFAIVDMYVNSSNVKSLLFNEHEGSAIVGGIAGFMTITNHIGFVGGFDIPLINRLLGGYVWGANYTNPEIEFTYDYTGDWVDVSAGQTMADEMYASGIDIIFAAAGRSSFGVYTSCKENNGTYEYPLWVIGVDTPQMYLGCEEPENPETPTVALTSMLKKMDLAVYTVIKEVIEGTFEVGIWIGALNNGGVDFEVNEDLLVLPNDVLTVVEELKEEIISNPSIVPSDKYWE
jgi:basic membrane protein A